MYRPTIKDGNGRSVDHPIPADLSAPMANNRSNGRESEHRNRQCYARGHAGAISQGGRRDAVGAYDESDIGRERHAGACDTGDPTTVSEQLESLLPLLARHAELDVETIGYHARQSDATANDGYWHAAINEARSFLEALVTCIALVEREQSLAEFRKARGMQGGIKLCRRYLLEVGFLDIDEDLLLAHVYGIASAKGSHVGLADEAWCRLARRIIRSTAEYLFHRLAAWNKTARRRCSTGHSSRTSGSHSPSNRSSPRIPWRDRLASFLRRAAIRAPGASLVTNDPQITTPRASPLTSVPESEHRAPAR